jgi:hypothetical protein
VEGARNETQGARIPSWIKDMQPTDTVVSMNSGSKTSTEKLNGLNSTAWKRSNGQTGSGRHYYRVTNSLQQLVGERGTRYRRWY